MSASQPLRVDPGALTTAGTEFDQAGASLAGLGADGPLADAAAAVPQLATAAAALNAQSAIAAETDEVAAATTTYGTNLKDAAAQYESGDHTAAASIDAAG